MSLKSKGITLHESIGRGGFGDVFKCTYKRKVCALKQIKLECDSKALQMIGAEVEIMEKMVHPRIVQFIDFFRIDDKWNILLEYMSGGSLATQIETRKKKREFFSQDEILIYFRDIAEGVAVLHDENIIHRDLKPDNILLDSNNRAKIADFGISKMLPGNCDFGAVNRTVTGTRSYWAPELARRVSYDISVDIWSLGVIFFEMALLKHPYERDDHKVMLPGFTPPMIPSSRYSRTLIKMLDNFMQYDPKKRIKAKNFVKFLDDYTDLKQPQGTNLSSSSSSSSSKSGNSLSSKHQKSSSSSSSYDNQNSTYSKFNDLSYNSNSTGRTITCRSNTRSSNLDSRFHNLNLNNSDNRVFENRVPTSRPDMSCIRDRLRTFANWPYPDDPEEQAEAGFFYLGRGSEIECFSCGIILVKDGDDDDIWFDHTKFSPSCQFVIQTKGLDYVNGVIQGNIRKKRVILARPDMKLLRKRLATFSSYPLDYDGDIDIENVAEAGFFYLGIGTQIQCFCCGIEGHANGDDDDPWFDHVKFSPKCHYVMVTKGSGYVKGVLDGSIEKQRQSIVRSILGRLQRAILG